MQFLRLSPLLLLVAAAALSCSYALSEGQSEPLLRRLKVLHHREALVARGKNGWSSVQYPKGAVEADIPVRGGSLRLFAMSKKGLDHSKIKRAVFVIHGQGRDPWNYYSHMTAALNDAVADGLVKKEEVGIWAPSFWDTADTGAFPYDEDTKTATSNIMAWHGSDWVDGAANKIPKTNQGVSSFEVLDDVVSYFSNKALFPKVETVVLAAHSAGSQMLHRYAQLGKVPIASGGTEVHFYIANPASWLYLDERRPEKGIGGATSRSKCPTYNEYKYGLNDVNENLPYGPVADAASIYKRYKTRYVHYQLGTGDHAQGSAACEAGVQGESHLTRGEIYQAYLQLLGSYPKRHTIDYVPGIGHNDKAMFSVSFCLLFLPSCGAVAVVVVVSCC